MYILDENYAQSFATTTGSVMYNCRNNNVIPIFIAKQNLQQNIKKINIGLLIKYLFFSNQ